MNYDDHSDARDEVSARSAGFPPHVSLQRIGANRWCVVDSRYPANDARCLIGYVERVDHVYHAIRLDSSPMTSFDELDLESILHDLEPAVSDDDR
ncbi:hypothetical protein [Humibacter ginsengisoli]